MAGFLSRRLARNVLQSSARNVGRRNASTTAAAPEPGLSIAYYMIPVLAAPALYMYLNGSNAIPEYVKANQQSAEDRREAMNKHLVVGKTVADAALARAELPSRFGPSVNTDHLAHSSDSNVGFEKH